MTEIAALFVVLPLLTFFMTFSVFAALNLAEKVFKKIGKDDV